MAKVSKPKAVRQPQYEKIASKYGLTLSNNLYGFKFQDVTQSQLFHFALLTNNILLPMFDGVSNKVKILASENIEEVREIAKRYNGEEYKPNIINDYD